MQSTWKPEKLVRLRGTRTQHDLASSLRQRGFGTTQTTVSRWEAGQVPRKSILPVLAEELGCQVEDIYSPESDDETRDVLEALRVRLLDALAMVEQARVC